jgi:hypothetical protein
LPAWRAPVYQTQAGIILLVQLARLLSWLVRLVALHPVAAAAVAVLVLAWVNSGWLGRVLLAAWALVVLAAWRTGSARRCAGSVPPGPGGWCWSSSAAMPWPSSSPPSPSGRIRT